MIAWGYHREAHAAAALRRSRFAREWSAGAVKWGAVKWGATPSTVYQSANKPAPPRVRPYRLQTTTNHL